MPEVPVAIRKFKVELDKERTFVASVGTQIRFGRVAGVNPYDGDALDKLFNPPRPEVLAQIAWAGCSGPEQVKAEGECPPWEDLAEYVNPTDAVVLYRALFSALIQSLSVSPVVAEAVAASSSKGDGADDPPVTGDLSEPSASGGSPAST